MIMKSNLQNPDKVFMTDETDSAIMNKTGGKFTSKDVIVDFNPSSADLLSGMDIFVIAEKTPVKHITVCWQIELESDISILADHFERGYGDLEWRGIVPNRIMPWYFMIHNRKTTDGVGVKTGPNTLCTWQLDQDVLMLHLDMRNGSLGTLLQGRKLKAATVISRIGVEGESPFRATQDFCRIMCENPILPTAPVYGGNNWYYAYGRSSQQKITEDAAFISSLAEDENRPFMVIDDGWQICRNGDFTGGPWHAGNKDFPDMAGLAADMKKSGVKPGLWIRPLLNCGNNSMSWRMPSNRFLKVECCSEFGCFLDPSVPEVLDLVKTDIERIVGWGYELIKHDFTTYDIFGRWGFDMFDAVTNENWHFHDRTKTTIEIILSLYRVIRKAAGNTMIIGCNTIGHVGAGLFEIQRTGDDTSGIEWERTRKMGVNTIAFRSAQHNTFFSADADCVGITENIPWELNERWLSLVSRSGTPLFVSADPQKVTDEQKEAIKKAFAIAAKPMDTCEPLDFLETTCPTKWRLNGEEYRFRWQL